jgi:signal transduction histidine kinase
MDNQSESTARSAPSLADLRTSMTDAEFVSQVLGDEQSGAFPHGAAQLGARVEASPEYIAVLSHELRNSLSVLRNAVRVLRLEKSPPPAVVQVRTLIERQVGHMTRLVEDLLQVSRIHGGSLRLQRARVDLRAVLRHCLQTVDLEMQLRGHHLTASIPEAPIWLNADGARLEQVFVNLLGNAAKYTGDDGHINLSLEREGADAVVRIRDNGIGIAADVLPRVFDLFMQADPSSTRADAGLGIGLALVRSLVASHGGEVSAASAGLGRGSELMVRLPLLSQSR